MPFRYGYLSSPERLSRERKAYEASEVYGEISSWDYVRRFVARQEATKEEEFEQD